MIKPLELYGTIWVILDSVLDLLKQIAKSAALGRLWPIGAIIMTRKDEKETDR